MADNVQDVRTNTDNGLTFVVPDYLYDRYVNGGIGEEEEVEPAVSEEVQRRRLAARARSCHRRKVTNGNHLRHPIQGASPSGHAT